MFGLTDNYRIFAMVVSVIFILVGILGFILDPFSGNLLGLFAVNLFHNGFHLIFGIVGIITIYMGLAKPFIRVGGILYLILGIAGFLPFLVIGGNLLGLVSTNLNDNILHLVVGLVAIVVGFAPQFAKQITPSAS